MAQREVKQDTGKQNDNRWVAASNRQERDEGMKHIKSSHARKYM